LAIFSSTLVAGAGLDQDPPGATEHGVGQGGFEQEAVVGQLDAVLVIGRGGLGPHDLGDEPEHAAAVEEEASGAEELPSIGGHMRGG
jgi:hypothetical protein